MVYDTMTVLILFHCNPDFIYSNVTVKRLSDDFEDKIDAEMSTTKLKTENWEEKKMKTVLIY